MADILQQVTTYNDSNLALLLNSYAVLSNANMKFKDFDKLEKNLGSSVEFDLPPRMTTKNDLVVTFQDVEQRVQTLTVDQQVSTAYDFTAEQFIFNVRDYMDKFGKSAVAEIGSKIEANVLQLAETNTYRFFGDGVTEISSYLQLANALAFFRNYGAAKTDTKGFLSDLTYPKIVNSGLNQFVTGKNEREMMSWEVGKFSNCEWHQSNLLKTHVAGTEGKQASVLTVVSFTINPATGGINSITFSGTDAAGDPDSVKAYDKFQFSDGVANKPNMRYRTFIGHEVSQSPVQFRATADAASDGGNQVTVNIFPELDATPGSRNQNINVPIEVDMQVTVLPDHRCGLIMAGNPLYLAMPRLPEEVPFPTYAAQDPNSGCSIRQYYGSLFGQNQRGMVHDAIWGSTLVDEYALMVALPV
jgi:hypothetical protein